MPYPDVEVVAAGRMYEYVAAGGRDAAAGMGTALAGGGSDAKGVDGCVGAALAGGGTGRVELFARRVALSISAKSRVVERVPFHPGIASRGSVRWRVWSREGGGTREYGLDVEDEALGRRDTRVTSDENIWRAICAKESQE